MKSSLFLFLNFIFINSNYKFIILGKMFHKQCLNKFQLDEINLSQWTQQLLSPAARICLLNLFSQMKFLRCILLYSTIEFIF